MSVSKVTIRLGTLDDVSVLIALGQRFYKEGGERAASTDELARFAISHICDQERVCLVAGDPVAAVLCGVLSDHYFTGEPTACKTAWYALHVARGYGAHLLRAFEAWAKEKGARRIIVAGRNERTLDLLGRLNYKPLETAFAKDIPWQKQHSLSS